MSARHLVFFDGYCGVCDWVVTFLMPYAKDSGFLFAPLQGETFKTVAVRFPGLEGVDSIVFVEHFDEPGRESARVKGEAALGILRRLPRSWAPLRVLLACLPSGLRDFFYDLVARNRHRIAKRRESCRIPTPEERKLFLP